MNALFAWPVDRIADTGRWFFDAWGDLGEIGGRIETWEHPEPEDEFVIGADFALGLQNSDFDTACVLKTNANPPRQVAELQGHWGPDFDRLLFATGVYYNEAFILGERQFGLDRLRSLLNDFGYGNLYYDRAEESRSRPLTDKLGYWRGTNDVCVPKLRRAIRHHELIVRSRTTIDQMRKLEYAPRTAAQVDNPQDKYFGIRLAGGGSPDLVMALAYAWHAVAEAPLFDRVVPRYRKGSLGDVLEHRKLYEPEEEPSRRRRRPS